MRHCLAALALVPVLFPTLRAQNGPNVPQPGLGVRQPPPSSDLLDQLVGFWGITGVVRELPVREVADAEWVLGHQFLEFHRTQVDEGGVETVVYVGYDPGLQRYVAFRLDSFGARNAEYPGYGLRTGDKLEFNFDYPNAPVRETWSWDAKEKTWQFLVEIGRKDSKGISYRPFSTLNLHHIPGGRGRRGPAPQLPHPSPPQPPQ